MSKTKVFLIFILVLAAVLRLWGLGATPPSPDWDEASLGYNAFSILHTGRDEYGATMPIILRSFDDYKPALYAYLIIPFIKIFGLNIVSVRLPSVLFGILAVLATFYLVRLLFAKSEHGTSIALLAAFFLAISPWHLQFSRVAFEACTGMAFNLFVVLFFLKGLKKHPYLLLSAGLASLNLYLYQSEKVFTPLLVLALVIIYWKNIMQLPKKYLIGAILLGLIFVAPLIQYTITNKSVFARAAGVSVFSDITPFLKDDAQRLIIDQQNHDHLGLLLDNRRFVFAKTIISGYLSHWDFNWLFISGDIARHHAPDMGILYLFELPLILVGIFVVFRNKDIDKKSKILIFTWFLLVPVPASITSGVPHAVRTLNFLPLFDIFSAVGLFYFLNRFTEDKNIGFRLVGVVFVIFALLNIGYYFDQYFVQLNYYNSSDWQYGYKDAVSYVGTIQDQYSKIIVSNQPYLDQSYIFFLFYLQYPPALYQQQAMTASGGFRENHTFGKFEFRPLSWNKEEKNSSILYIGRVSDFPQNAHVLKTVNFLDGSPAIEIVKG